MLNNGITKTSLIGFQIPKDWFCSSWSIVTKYSDIWSVDDTNKVNQYSQF